jgi:Anthrax toxin LF subunit
MRYNDHQFLIETIGMPTTHKQAFLTVAALERCVIMVRATGPTCHGLLDEGYDTKGYRIHGKSCDWGPMAGFVMRDPRLNKYGNVKAGFNREKHGEAIVHDSEGQRWKASTTPLKISRRRVDWLVRKGYIAVQAKGNDRLDGHATHPTGITFYYSLIREAAEQDLYGVYFDNTQIGKRWIQEKGSSIVKYHPKYGASYEPMLAMTNPPGYGLHATENYKNAITGDYDLFAVWPFVEGPGGYDPSPYGNDHRPLGTVKGSVGDFERANVDRLEREFTESGQGAAQIVPVVRKPGQAAIPTAVATPFAHGRNGSGTKLGNITPRIYMVCQLINSIVGRHILWHSDEAARPFLDDVDLPVLALTPRGNYVGIENIMDFKIFISFCDKEGIKVTLSNAWAQDPEGKHQKRLGLEYSRYVPPDGKRIVVPDWYNG